MLAFLSLRVVHNETYIQYNTRDQEIHGNCLVFNINANFRVINSIWLPIKVHVSGCHSFTYCKTGFSLGFSK